jgi:hypothetical protein
MREERDDFSVRDLLEAGRSRSEKNGAGTRKISPVISTLVPSGPLVGEIEIISGEPIWANPPIELMHAMKRALVIADRRAAICQIQLF